MTRLPACLRLSDLRQVDAGRKHGADHPAGARLRGRHPPPVVGHGHPALLQPPLRVPAPGLHRVVSRLSSGGVTRGSHDVQTPVLGGHKPARFYHLPGRETFNQAPHSACVHARLQLSGPAWQGDACFRAHSSCQLLKSL